MNFPHVGNNHSNLELVCPNFKKSGKVLIGSKNLDFYAKSYSCRKIRKNIHRR